jgi:hypothetical protein
MATTHFALGNFGGGWQTDLDMPLVSPGLINTLILGSMEIAFRHFLPRAQLLHQQK